MSRGLLWRVSFWFAAICALTAFFVALTEAVFGRWTLPVADLRGLISVLLSGALASAVLGIVSFAVDHEDGESR